MSTPPVRAHGLGGPRNGIPERKPYIYGATRRGQGRPSQDDEPTVEQLVAASRARLREALEAEGRCTECFYPLDSFGHDTLCGEP